MIGRGFRAIPRRGDSRERRHKQAVRLEVMSATIEPEPSEAERKAILAALERADEAVLGEWAKTALLKGVESSEISP